MANTYGLTYQLDQFSIFGAPKQHTRTLYPTLTWLRLNTDDPIRTVNGNRININLRGSTHSLASDIDFAQTQVNLK